MSRKKPRVLVAFDSNRPTSFEDDFTHVFDQKDFETENDVAWALDQIQYPYELVGVYDSMDILQKKVAAFKPDIIFNLMEHFNCRSDLERDVVSFLNLMGLPYTGCGPTGITLSKNKGLSKQILAYHRIRVPRFVMLPRGKRIHRPRQLEFPVFVKPLKEEASYGVAQASFVETDAQFRDRISWIHESLGCDVIAEQYIQGRELYASVMGYKRLEVFPIRELYFGQVPDEEPKIATFKAKWDQAYRKKWGIQNRFAGGLQNGLEEKIMKTVKKIYRLLSIRGYARMDLRLTPSGEVYFLEANPNPMLADFEDFAVSARKAGLEYPELIRKIIHMSLKAPLRD